VIHASKKHEPKENTHMKILITVVIVCGALFALTPAFAHSEHKAKSAPIKKEQQVWGIAGDKKNAKRTIRLTMTDQMRFVPDKFEVKEGETVRIALKNNGTMLHEMVIGTMKELDEHAALMVKFPNMEHDEPHMAHVAPGKSGEIVWTFNRAGQFDFACLIAGHYQAGMVGKINVIAANPVSRKQ
jgi:uncharacterized cupredoxin-like copper-binding protein